MGLHASMPEGGTEECPLRTKPTRPRSPVLNPHPPKYETIPIQMIYHNGDMNFRGWGALILGKVIMKGAFTRLLPSSDAGPRKPAYPKP